MERVGVDPAGVGIMAPKHFHYNLKVEGLNPAQANILKQEMLSIGGEAAVARGVSSCSVERTDAVVSGTRKQFEELFEKLKRQRLGLPDVAASMSEALVNSGQRSYLLRFRDRGLAIGPATVIMGILNVTPDSFSDGGEFLDHGKAVLRGLEMSAEGADWIDVGGESTRPGAVPVGAEEEKRRVLPVVEALAKQGLTVSIDTTKAAVAEAAIDAGAAIINDVSAMSMDEDMAEVAARSGSPVVLMHMRGTPGTMQSDTGYKDLMGEVFGYLRERVEYAVSKGIDAQGIIIDPGLGFGKSYEGNLELLSRLRELKSLGRPILVGASRKSFIGKAMGGAEAGERLNGTLGACAAAIMNGASILRVHDVKEAREAARVVDAITGMK
ncbi:MAG TPA: dihydropteroate synthase [Thermodesulfobacteriota bacterium]